MRPADAPRALGARSRPRPPGAHRIGDFTLLDQRGGGFGADSLRGQVYVASFFFAECRDVCPLTVQRLKGVADTFAAEDRVRLVSFSVRPERDSVAALAMYAAMHHIDGRRWRLLTGARATIERMAEEHLIGLGRGSDYGVAAVEHTEMVVLVDQARHVRGVYNGTVKLDMAQLIRDTKWLLGRQNGPKSQVDAPGRSVYSSLLDSRLLISVTSTAAGIP